MAKQNRHSQTQAQTQPLTGKLRQVAVSAWLVAIVVALGLVSLLADGGAGLEKFAQFMVGGVALGSIYSLLALGFVVIYKATGIFNLAQGSLVLLGTFLVYQFYEAFSWPFALALPAALVIMAVVGILVERLVMRKMLGKPVFSSIMVTLALLIIIDQIVQAIWSETGYVLSLPQSSGKLDVGGVTISHIDFWAFGAAAVLLLAFFAFFERTRLGLGMRATALDAEVASAQGVRISVAYSLSWAIAAVVATVAGMILTVRTGGGALTPAVGYIALRAFPAMILGGLDSTGGAVAGGLIIGLAEVMVDGYLDYDWLGEAFETVVPYLLLLPIMLWRPHGLFGTKTVERS